MHPIAPTAESSLISAQRLSVSYGGAHVLDGVSVEVGRGEIVTLIGPNGSGKTTLVRALLGLVAPDSGSVTRRARRIGYVPQLFARDRSLPMTARRFVAAFGGGSDAEAFALLRRTGAAQAADRQMAFLSGGEMARVALARALLRKPDLLILDEPLAGVDLAGEAALYELIAQVRSETGVGILLVSHDLHMVMAASDHIVCLNRHVCCEGDAHEVVHDPAFIALFGKRLADQLALYTHRHDHAHDASGAVLEHGDHAHHAHHDGHGHAHGEGNRHG
jgi:zinc transport system ATP-binding protein